MNPGDFIMVSLREDETNQNNADIVHKYFPEEVEELLEVGEIPEEFGTGIENLGEDDENEGEGDDEDGEP